MAYVPWSIAFFIKGFIGEGDFYVGIGIWTLSEWNFDYFT